MKILSGSAAFTLFLVAFAGSALAGGPTVNINQTFCRAQPGASPLVTVAIAPPGTTGTRQQIVCLSLDKVAFTVDGSTNPPTLKILFPPQTPPANSAVFVDDETPAGVIDGVNRAFTLSVAPVTASVKVYRNGVRQRAGVDYSLAGNVITFILESMPSGDDILLVDYRALTQ